MKNLTISVICVLAIISYGKADYNSPPDWQDSNDFTHQSWDFDYDSSYEPNGPPLPQLPDGEPNWTNPFGQPELISVAFTDYPFWIPGIVGWQWDYSQQGFVTDRRGYWGGMGNTILTFKIPNYERLPLWQKQVWIQMTYLARNDNEETYDIELATDSNFTDVNIPEPAYLHFEEPNEPNNPEGNVSKWYRVTAAYVLAEQPDEEYIRLTARHIPPDPCAHPLGGPTMFDQVDIDTRCINPDFFSDDIVNFKDYALLVGNYCNNAPKFDLWPDERIDINDLNILFSSWIDQNQN